MNLGYLHLGEPDHGLHRYGRLLAREARRRGDLEVLEVEARLEGGTPGDRRQLTTAAERLSESDVVHVQHNRDVWGRGRAQHANVRAFLAACRAPVVATCHDVYPRDPWAPWRRRRVSWRRLRRHWRERRPTNRTLRTLLERCAEVLVCTDEEAARLATLTRRARPTRVIDHFVEDRPPLPGRDDARRSLGLEGAQVVTLLGYIHPSKGHDLLVEALPLLPPDVHAVLAGRPSPGNEDFLRRLERRAERHDVAGRLHVTGWLDDAGQARVLAATDLAVAPFRFFSASGSLSTWISAAAPILCHDLPQLARYDAIAPGAIARFSPFSAPALAEAISRDLARARHPDPEVARLRDALAMARVFDLHAAVYRRVAGPGREASGAPVVVGDGAIG